MEGVRLQVKEPQRVQEVHQGFSWALRSHTGSYSSEVGVATPHIRRLPPNLEQPNPSDLQWEVRSCLPTLGRGSQRDKRNRAIGRSLPTVTASHVGGDKTQAHITRHTYLTQQMLHSRPFYICVIVCSILDWFCLDQLIPALPYVPDWNNLTDSVHAKWSLSIFKLFRSVFRGQTSCHQLRGKCVGGCRSRCWAERRCQGPDEPSSAASAGLGGVQEAETYAVPPTVKVSSENLQRIKVWYLEAFSVFCQPVEKVLKKHFELVKKYQRNQHQRG